MPSLRPFAAAFLFALLALGACGADFISIPSRSRAFTDDAPPLPMIVAQVARQISPKTPCWRSTAR